jgi:gamma-glutamyltranspeptidase/glutathione hydrolase
MLRATLATRGMVTAPHHLAAQAGLSVLREGGNAIEAMVAAASTIAVVYPHMNGLGGDNFWLVSHKGAPPIAIDACGAAAAHATADFYADHGCATAIPARGPLSALTVAGAVSGWQAALEMSRARGGRLPLARLFEDATHYARHGVPVSGTQSRNSAAKRAELEAVPGFAAQYLPGGAAPETGALFRNPRLAATLDHLATAGLDDFYRGDLAATLAAELQSAGSPLTRADFARHHALTLDPLALSLPHADVYGMPPPTQGLASLMILGLFERIKPTTADGFAHVHALVEATKRAFMVRNAEVTDPAYMTADPRAFLTNADLDARAALIDPARALPWPHAAKPGDTVWLGAVDKDGTAVSFIQSIYWEFGSGVVLPTSGIVWQNRGTSFGLDPAHVNALRPHRRPFHTIQPALALFRDGRVMPFGTMGGEGQPQTKAALFTRYATYGQDLQAAITAPRWLLGRTWGAATDGLKIENRFPPEVIEALRTAGHEVEVVGAFEEMMGHAGAIVQHTSGSRAGVLEGASDPRSDGHAAGY